MMLDGDMEKISKEKQQKFLQGIMDKSGKLEIIINDILSASEFDSQKFSLTPNSPHLQLEEIVAEVIKNAEQEAEQRGIEIQWQPPKEPLPKIAGEKKYLEQAITNLVGNALKYTPS